MKRVDVLRDLLELYENIVSKKNLNLYFELQSEIDQYYESLDTQTNFKYDSEELELLKRIFDLHQELVQLMEDKQLQSGMMNRVSRSTYSNPNTGESYFFDKKS